MVKQMQLLGLGTGLLLAGGSLVASAVSGCGGTSPGGFSCGGMGGATTSTGTTCTADVELNTPAMPTPEDITLCTALAARETACSPACPAEPIDHCARFWACIKLSIRPDMLTDIYACMPKLACTVVTDNVIPDMVGTCAAMQRLIFPASAAQLAYEAAVAKATAASGDPCAQSPCADGVCGGWMDDYYDAKTACVEQGENIAWAVWAYW